MKERKLSWGEHFDLVKSYIDRYMAENKIETWFSSSPASLEFIVDDLNHSKNACAKKVGENSYEIRIYAGLIKELLDNSYQVVWNSKGIFRRVSRDPSNSEMVGNCQIYILFIWIEYIFFHELAHIACGHLDILGLHSWAEMASEGTKKNKITNYQLQRLEAQADGFAIRNFIGGMYLRSWRSISSSLYGEENHIELFRDNLLAIFYLFKVFDHLQEGKIGADAAHPSPFIRANVCWFKLKQFYQNVDELPPLTDLELRDLVYGSFMEFYVNEYGFTTADFERETDIVNEFMGTVSDVLAELGLPLG